jgi:hypothetical protein
MPEQVRRAVILLWASFGISAVEVVVAEVLETSDPMIWGLLLFTYGVWAWVIVAIWKQRNWARIVSLVVVVVTTALWVAWPDARPEQWSEAITIVASLLLEAAALFLLFTGAGAAWFRARAA